MIDREVVQFEQVAELMKSFGVDLDHRRFLILQVRRPT